VIKADVAELVDARDLKSLDGNVVWVRVPPPAPKVGATKHPITGAAEQLVAVERDITLNLVDAVDFNLGVRQPLVEILAALDMRRLILIPAGLDVPIGRRIDMNIDIFRKSINDLEAF
jgi:hypothetical protein